MHTAVLGAQWGDEGKGKIVDLIAPEHDINVRCQGGNNAGHTVVVGEEKFPFHLLPSAVLHPGKVCVLGNGMVIDPGVLYQEIKTLEERVGKAHADIKISSRAHAITPAHIAEDVKNQKDRFGTTGRGIGPAYASKINREGIRFTDINSMGLKRDLLELLSPLITDTVLYLNEKVDDGKRLLFEGAQALMLDVDHGTYPFVTSSNCGVGGLFTGSGVYVKDLNIIGVVKAYTTAVGRRPFVGELLDETGNIMVEKGAEYGTTTGRRRRVKWLDMVALKHSNRVNRYNELAVTKLDVLTGFTEVKVCVGYALGGKSVNVFPADIKQMEVMEPFHVTFPGWKEDLSECRSFDELPESAKNYIRFIESSVGVPVKYIGVGPGREQIIVRKEKARRTLL